MKLKRVLTIREILLGIVLGILCYGGITTYGQARYQPQPSDPSLWQLRRQVEAIEKDTRSEQKELLSAIAGLRTDVAVMQSQVSIVTRIGWIILTGVSGYVVQALWGAVAAKRAISAAKKADTEDE